MPNRRFDVINQIGADVIGPMVNQWFFKRSFRKSNRWDNQILPNQDHGGFSYFRYPPNPLFKLYIGKEEIECDALY